MVVRILKNLLWIGSTLAILASTSARADYLFQDGYYKKRNTGSFQRQFQRGTHHSRPRYRSAPRYRQAPRYNNRGTGSYRIYRNQPNRGRFNRNFNRGPGNRAGRACRSVDSAIWAAQRRYPGGRVIKARAVTGYGRGYIEVRILFRGRVLVYRQRC